MTTFYISTKLNRRGDFPHVLDFEVKALLEVDDEARSKAAATLEGFVLRRTYDLDHLSFDDFDSRSGHTYDGYNILTKHQQEICSALKIKQDDLELVGDIIFCENLVVDPEYRKNKLALRLLREPIWAFGNFSSLMILKAHPAGEGMEDDDCRKLADYYRSDKSLKFEELDRKNLAGWLVSKGAWDEYKSDDEYYYDGIISDED